MRIVSTFGFPMFLLSIALPMIVAARDRVSEQAIQIPIADVKGHPRLMQGRVCRPNDVDRPKLAIINHGSPSRASDRPDMEPIQCDSEAAQWFLHRNYAVVFVLRLGYGASGGPWTEAYGDCEDADYFHAGLETAREIDVIVNYALTLPSVDPTDVIVVGQSAGGWGTIAYDSIAHPHVVGFINMAGGRGGHYHDRPNSNCHPEKLVEAAAQYGKTAATPMLWIYAKNDSFFNPKLASAMYQYFAQAGGRAEFVSPASFGKDGHHLFLGSGGSHIWGPAVEKYLATVVSSSSSP